jgi:tetratricopeptide (TPR) repeat protein
MGQLLIETDFNSGLQKLKNAIDIAQKFKIPENELVQRFFTNILDDEIARLCQLAQDELKRQNIEETISLLEKALKLAIDNNDLDWQTSILVFLGKVIAVHKSYDKGVNHLKNALELAEKENFEEVDKIQNTISSIEHNKIMQQFQTAYSAAQNGKIQESINLLLKSLEFQRSINHVEMQIATLGLIGQLFEHQANFQEALRYLQEALEISQKLESEENIELIHKIMSRIISL